MAIDHANYFIAQRHPVGEHWGGAFPEYGSAIAFLTRAVTHLSAPGFFFLMGAGITLFSASRIARGWSWRQISGHFLVRGLVLIVLQFAVVNPIWKISPLPFPRWYQGVLVALGGTMLLSILFLRARTWHLFAASGLLMLGLELSHPNPAQWGQLFDEPLGLVFGYSGGSQVFWVNYPILPWLELVLLGMGFGRLFERDPKRGYRWALILGMLMLLAFFPLRLLNGFGNIRPMAGRSWIDILNVVKYPPSLTFTFLTTGVILILLALFKRFENAARSLLNLLAVYGRSPLFLYLAHLLLYALLGRWLTPAGTSYAPMYFLWLVGLVILFQLAQGYSRLSQQPQLRPIFRFL